MTETNARAETAPERSVGLIRLGTGLLQGLCLYGLIQASEGKTWPFTDQPLFAALFLVVLFAPAPILASIGRMRLPSLLGWTAIAALLLAAFGFYDAWRQPTMPEPGKDWEPERAVFAAVGLFVAHVLIAAADADRRRIGRYETIFALATKFAVQLGLSFAFVGVLWILLFVGASLFEVIGLKGFKETIGEAWFAAPVSAVTFAAAVHLTDVRSGLIRAIRTLGLTLLSWLTPIMTAIAAAFLVALPFTGLEPLWNTGSATAMLLVAAAALAVLVNAVYQDGEGDEARPAVLRWSARAAAVLLVPIVGLAIYGLMLRIGQHGLSPDRIVAGAIAAVAAVLAAGYAFAAVRPGEWMKPVGLTNVAAACVGLVLLASLFSPIADPARLSVNSQMARLERGEITPDEFDYAFLRFDGGRWGAAALQRLKASNNAAIAEHATSALKAEYRRPSHRAPDMVRADPARFKIAPAGRALPREFIALDVPVGSTVANCAELVGCTAIIADLNQDGSEEVIVSQGSRGEIYGKASTGSWSRLGALEAACEGSSADILPKAVALSPPAFPDVQIGEHRFRVVPDRSYCLATPPAPTP